jgi:hypothetical protein
MHLDGALVVPSKLIGGGVFLLENTCLQGDVATQALSIPNYF